MFHIITRPDRHPFKALLFTLVGAGATSALMPVANAADLGGNCCADLEERLADLVATTGTKGNIKVSLTKSGWTNVPQLNFSKGSFSLELSQLSFVTTVTPGTPFVVSGSRIAVLDASSFTYENRAGRAVLHGVDQSVAGALDGGALCAAPDESKSTPRPNSCTRRNIWAVGIGSYSDIDASRSAFTAEQTMAGILSGAQFDAAPGVTVGLFGGYAQTNLKTEFDAEHLDTGFGIGGAYGRLHNGLMFADLGVTGLWSNTDRSRQIASNAAGHGIYEYTTAASSGWLISPSLALGTTWQSNADTVVVPEVKIRGHIGQNGGFAETGSTANFAAQARDVRDLEARIQFGVRHKFATPDGVTGSVRAEAGVSYLGSVGDETVSGRLLGKDLRFASGIPRSEYAGYVGTGIDIALTPAAALFAESELLLSHRAQELSGTAGFRVKF
jgi:uncharacterized protein with beta-barrel porin domain